MKPQRKIIIALVLCCYLSFPLSLLAQLENTMPAAMFAKPTMTCNNGQAQLCVTLQMAGNPTWNFWEFGISSSFNQQAITNPVYHPISFLDTTCYNYVVIDTCEQGISMTSNDNHFEISFTGNDCSSVIENCEYHVLNAVPIDIGRICFDVVNPNQDIHLYIDDLESFFVINDLSVPFITFDLHFIPATMSNEGAPTAAFTTNPAATNPTQDTLYVCRNQVVTFNNTSGNSNVFQWDFGDNSQTTATNPTHSYAQAGTYTVQMVANNVITNTLPCQIDAVDDYVQQTPNLLINVLQNDFFNGICSVEIITPPIYGTATVTAIGDILYNNENMPISEKIVYAIQCLDTTCSDTATIYIQSPCPPFVATTTPICDPATGGYLIILTVGGGIPSCNGFGVYTASCPEIIANGSLLISGENAITAIFTNEDGLPFPPNSPPFICTISDGLANIDISMSFPTSACSNDPLPPPTTFTPTAASSTNAPQLARQEHTNSQLDTDYCGANSATMVIVVLDGIIPSLNCYSPICANTYQTYNATTSCNNYNWSVEGGSIVSNSNDSIVVYWDGSTTQGLIHLEIYNCSEELCSGSMDFPIPVIAPNAPIEGDTMVCSNEIVTYTTPHYSGSEYHWTIIPSNAGQIRAGGDINSNFITIEWQQSAQLRVQYAHSLLPCSDSSQININVAPAFQVATNGSFCNNQVANISVYVPNTQAHIVQYWGGTLLEYLTHPEQTSYFLQPNSDTDSLSLTAYLVDNNIYCNDSASITLPLLPNPPAPTAIVGSTVICPDIAYTYSVNGVIPNANLEWNIVNGQILQNGTDNTVVVKFYANSTEHHLSAHQEVAGCTSDDIVFSPTLLTDNNLQIIGLSDVCANSTKNYITNLNLPTNSNSIWSITPPEAGNILSGQNTNTVAISWNALNIPAELSLSYCNYTVSLPINIHQLPTVNIEQTIPLCSNSNTTLNATDGFSDYLWSTNSISATIDINEAGIYSVSVTDSNGCIGVDAIEVGAYPAPIANISTIDHNIICINDPHNVVMYSLLGDNYQYNWIKNGIPTGFTADMLVHIPDINEITTTYQMEITHAITGCRQLSNAFSIIQSICDSNGDPYPTCPPETNDTLVIVCTIPINANAIMTIVDPCANPITVNNFSSGDAAYYKWSFGDQTPDITTFSPDDNPTHNYELPGFYKIWLKAYYENQTPQPDYCALSTYHTINIPFHVDFYAQNGCLGSEILFTDYSVHSHLTTITSYFWDFGDGTTANEINPTHIYTNSGIYNVTLTIGNDTCYQSISKPIVIYSPTSIALNDPLNVCDGSRLQLNMPDNIIAAWYDFGDGNQATGTDVGYQYTQTGNHVIQISANDSNGCTTNISTNVNVLPLPDVSIDIAQNNWCNGDSALLAVQSANITAYLWDDGSIDSTRWVDTTGIYSVSVTDTNGCVASISTEPIIFHPLPVIEVLPNETSLYLCPNNSLNISLVHYEGNFYDWSNGTNDNQIVVNSVGAYTVTVTDIYNNCSAVSEPIIVQAGTLPQAPIIIATDLMICAGETTTFTAMHNSLSNFIWSNGSTTPSITVYNGGDYTVSVTNEQNCTNTKTQTLYVVALPNINTFPTGCYTVCDNTELVINNNTATLEWYYNGTPIINNGNSNTITLSEAGDYSLHAYNALGCEVFSDTLSIELVTCHDPLAVELLSFQGELLLNGNELYWISANEINSDYFSLQHSYNGQDYVTINTQNASHNSNTVRKYTYLDQQTISGWHYYRLLETDINGKSAVVGQLALYRTSDSHSNTLKIFPNPTNAVTQLQYTAKEAGIVQCRLLDISGRLLLQKDYATTAGNNLLQIDLQAYSSGMYWVEVLAKDGIIVGRLIKQ